LDLVHPVENEDKLQRAVRRNHKAINRRPYDLTRPNGKPLWMRWHTWKRLSEEFVAAAMVQFEQHHQAIVLLKQLDKSRSRRKRAR
jgi:hypothetical protein